MILVYAVSRVSLHLFAMVFLSCSSSIDLMFLCNNMQSWSSTVKQLLARQWSVVNRLWRERTRLHIRRAFTIHNRDFLLLVVVVLVEIRIVVWVRLARECRIRCRRSVRHNLDPTRVNNQSCFFCLLLACAHNKGGTFACLHKKGGISNSPVPVRIRDESNPSYQPCKPFRELVVTPIHCARRQLPYVLDNLDAIVAKPLHGLGDRRHTEP